MTPDMTPQHLSRRNEELRGEIAVLRAQLEQARSDRNSIGAQVRSEWMAKASMANREREKAEAERDAALARAGKAEVELASVRHDLMVRGDSYMEKCDRLEAELDAVVHCRQCLDTGIAPLGNEEGEDFCEACPVGREKSNAAECDELCALNERLSNLLKDTANALKGDPGPLKTHDWSDLPKVAADAIAARDWNGGYLSDLAAIQKILDLHGAPHDPEEGISNVATRVNILAGEWLSLKQSAVHAASQRAQTVVTDAMVSVAVAAWNCCPVKAHGHLIDNRFEYEQMRAALVAGIGEGEG